MVSRDRHLSADFQPLVSLLQKIASQFPVSLFAEGKCNEVKRAWRKVGFAEQPQIRRDCAGSGAALLLVVEIQKMAGHVLGGCRGGKGELAAAHGVAENSLAGDCRDEVPQ